MLPTYATVTDRERLQAHFGVSLPEGHDPAWPGDVIVTPLDGAPPGALGEARLARQAWPSQPSAPCGPCPVETMKSHPAYRESWWAGRRCVVPVERISAWCLGAGRPELQHIESTDGTPLALAGLWKAWEGPTGEPVTSFCLLTLPATGHALFSRLLAAEGEPRMPAVLPAAALALWLHGSLKEAERLLQPCPAAALRALSQEPAHTDGHAPERWAAIPDMFPLEWHALAAAPARASRRPARTARPRVPAAPGPTTADLF